jgi:DNA repair exonuclease SbcCD ATPase subunit
MNAIISRIFVFGQNQEKREVKLSSGLNIITGDSKTGKSALLEIVDYCLFASRSTIPKGVVEDFAILYSIVLKVSEKYLVIARFPAKTGNGNKALLKIETNDQFLEGIKFNYFSDLQLRPLKEIQSEVEKHLGLSVLDTRLDEEDDKRNGGGKATLRSCVPFLFQHQNLIANKHSIFYRFEDFYKRKKTIEDFPILIGWESSEYFIYRRELEKKQKELKADNKLVKSLKLKDEEIQFRLRSIIESYYNVIGLEIDTRFSLSELKEIAKKLPDVSNTIYADSNIKGKVQVKLEEIEDLRAQLTEVQELLALLERSSVDTQGHAVQLRFLEMTSNIESNNESLVCPVCRSINPALSDEIIAIHHSKEELKNELAKIGVYKEDNSQQIEELRKRRNSYKRQITIISSEIDALEKQDKEFQNKKSLRDQAFLAKGMAEANIKNLLLREGQNALFTDVDELTERIAWLKLKLEGFDLKSKIKDAEVFLSNKMTDICNKLDFEKELKPGVLRFSIEDFVFYYHFKDREKIYLSEMGSGANWLACHLSLFIALLHLNCREKKSTIPSFLFIDQPSQVYFPTKYREAEDGSEEKIDENVMQVRNIFRVVIEALTGIEDECGFLPQIVVMEHADENEFDKYVKARWKKDGRKLV